MRFLRCGLAAFGVLAFSLAASAAEVTSEQDVRVIGGGEHAVFNVATIAPLVAQPRFDTPAFNAAVVSPQLWKFDMPALDKTSAGAAEVGASGQGSMRGFLGVGLLAVFATWLVMGAPLPRLPYSRRPWRPLLSS